MHEVADNLIALRENGKTVLIITHDLELILKCCSHVLHLDDGKIKESYVLDAEGIKRIKSFFIHNIKGAEHEYT